MTRLPPIYGILLLFPLTVFAASSQEIADAIHNLGADEHKTRAAASEFLWSVGMEAVPALEKAVHDPDPEIRERARDLLTSIRTGARPDTPPDLLPMLEAYHNAPNTMQREAVLRSILEYGPTAVPTLLNLIQTVSNSEKESFYQIVHVDDDELLRQLNAQNWTWAETRWRMRSSVERNKTPLAVRLACDDPIFRQMAVQTLFEKKAALKIPAWEQDFHNHPSPYLARLLAYTYRAQSQPDKAIAMAAQAGDPDFHESMLAELNHWEDLCRLFAAPLEKAADWRSLARLAFYQHHAGHEDAATRILDRLRTMTVKPEEKVVFDCLFLANECPDDAIQRIAPPFAVSLLLCRKQFEQAFAVLHKSETLPPLEITRKALVEAQILHQLGETNAALRIMQRLFADEDHSASPETANEIETVAVNLNLRVPESFPRYSQAHDTFRRDYFISTRGRFPTVWQNRNFGLTRFYSIKDLGAAVERCAGIAGQHIVEYQSRLYSPATPDEQLNEIFTCLQHESHVTTQNALPLALVAARADLDDWTLKFADQTGNEALVIVGDVYRKQKKWDAAMLAYQSAAQAFPDKPLPIFLQGVVSRKLGNDEYGRQLMEASHGLARGSARFADDLSERGFYDDAAIEDRVIVKTRPLLTPYFEISGDDWSEACPHPEGWMEHAAIHEHGPLVVLSATQTAFFGPIEQGLIIPHHVHYLKLRGYLEQHDLDNALTEARAGLRLLPCDTKILVWIIPALDQQGRKSEADKLFSDVNTHLESIIVKYPSYAQGHHDLARLALGCNRQLTTGLTHAQKAADLDPNNKAYRDTLTEIQKAVNKK